MEVRGQEHVMDHSPERRNHNGTSVFTCAQQTLDHTHRPHHRNRPAGKGVIRYRECLKNHAASMGGNIFDGCGEFMPSGEEGTLEALKCAACECHRNFHRKEVDGETQIGHGRRAPAVMLNPLQLPPPLPSPNMLKYSVHTSPSSAMVAPMNVTFGSGGGGGGGTESSSEDLNVFQSNAEGYPPPPPPPFVMSKKRFRTKFTQEQKGKMQEFAEKLGWRINRQEEEQVEKFCAEVGVKRQVFKVWMHNNKNNAKKQPAEQQQQQDINGENLNHASV